MMTTVLLVGDCKKVVPLYYSFVSRCRYVCAFGYFPVFNRASAVESRSLSLFDERHPSTPSIISEPELTHWSVIDSAHGTLLFIVPARWSHI